ncbi:MAG TPA: AMP-binding protein, partial [Burkholderiales bacterium]|nr:AMP-binding protein [Burkholderiales bacterium]
MNAVESLLGEAAQSRHGERLAFICGEESKSYAQLAREVQAAAAALAALGVVPGDRVLLLMRDTPEFAAAWLGVVRLGAVAVALNDKLSEAEYRHILADCAARLALVEERFANARPDLSAELARDGRLALVGSHRAGVPEWRELVARQHAGPEAFDAAFDASPDTPAFALYSSGTTGRPKGILHSHKSILCAGAGLRLLGINPSERVFATSRLFFAYGLEHGFLGTLALGATSILCPDWPDAAAVIATTARHKPAVVFSVPTIYRRLL